VLLVDVSLVRRTSSCLSRSHKRCIACRKNCRFVHEVCVSRVFVLPKANITPEKLSEFVNSSTIKTFEFLCPRIGILVCTRFWLQW
jgi:hypothetical protein